MRSATSRRWTSRRRTRPSTMRRSWRSPRCACATAQIVDIFNALVKPDAPDHAGATDTHGIRAADVADGAAVRGHLAEVRARSAATTSSSRTTATSSTSAILDRMVRALGKRFELCTYDTLPLARDLFRTSRKLSELARRARHRRRGRRTARSTTRARSRRCSSQLGDAEAAARAQDGAREPARPSSASALALCDKAIAVRRSAAVPRLLRAVRVRPVQLVPRDVRARARRADESLPASMTSSRRSAARS